MSSSEVIMAMDEMISSKRNAVRENANPTGLTTDQIEMSSGPAFIEHLIKFKREKYHSQNDRHEVMCSDPIARFVCDRWFKEVTGKPFKCYDTDMEGNPEEVMTDIWERWDQLNMNEPFRAIGEKTAADGYCVGDLYITAANTPGYHAFGFFETPPEYWKRYNMKGSEFHNVIYEYYVEYWPIPNGWEYEVNYNIHAEEFWVHPTDPGYFHFTRDRWNYGIGKPRIQGIWASLTKLRKISHADFRRKLVFNVFEYPEDWDAEKGLEEMIQAFRRADEVEGVAYPKRINQMTGETEDWPKFFDRTADMQGATPGGDASAGGSLLRNPEYARVLIDLGYTETKFVGNQPGAVEGSKLDFNENDEVDMREFSLYKPIIKWMLLWLLENGFLEGCDPESLVRVQQGDYDIKCHIEWEVLENQVREAELAAEQMEDQAEFDANKQNKRYNTAIAGLLHTCLVLNQAMPMTPVMSSWIKAIGYEPGMLYMQVQQPTRRGITTYGYMLENPEEPYMDWVDSKSKGEFWWDVIGPQYGPGLKHGQPPAYLQTGYGGQLPYTQETTQQYKMFGEPQKGIIGAGTTAAPFGMTTTPASTTQTTTPMSTTPSYYTPTWGYEASEKSITGHVKRGKGAKRSRGKSTSRAPIVPVNYTYPVNAAFDKLSFKKANNLYEQINHVGMTNKTWVKFRNFVTFLEDNNFPRDNSIVDEGNPMNFDLALRYAANNDKGFVEEYVCKKEWKKIQAHDGELVIYPDLKHSGKFEVVGTYNYWYDEKLDKPMITRQIDDDKIRELLTGWGKENCSIMSKLNKGTPLSMSTEYRCGILVHNNKRYQVNFHNDNFEPYLNRIAIVEHGNCDDPFCTFKEVKEGA